MSSSNEANVIKFLEPKNIAILLMIPLSLLCSITVFNPVTIINSYSQEETIKLTAIFAEPKERWDILIEKALEKLNEIHPDKKSKLNIVFYHIQIQGHKFLRLWLASQN
jgi:hypothetical protein